MGVIGVRRQFLPDIVTVEQAQRLFATTRNLSYRVFFFTLYSLGLRLSEGLALKVGDIDGARGRVHIRDSKGNRDRLVPSLKNQAASNRAGHSRSQNPSRDHARVAMTLGRIG